MKTCSEYCLPGCDFCRHYRDYYDVDARFELENTGFGLCLVLQEIVAFDWSCNEFYCLIAWRRENSVIMKTEDNRTDTALRKSSRRDLKGFAGGIAHMFSCSAQHYAWLAHQFGISVGTVDLFFLRITPEEFDIGRNRTLAEQCRSTLLRNLERLKPPAAVTSAILTINFGIHDYRKKDTYGASIGASTFTVILTDDRGKEWVGTVADQRVLAQGGSAQD